MDKLNQSNLEYLLENISTVLDDRNLIHNCILWIERTISLDL